MKIVVEKKRKMKRSNEIVSSKNCSFKKLKEKAIEV